jgi:hypothetical protein
MHTVSAVLARLGTILWEKWTWFESERKKEEFRRLVH